MADIMNKSNIKKEKGVDVLTVFGYLLTLAFTGKSLNITIINSEVNISKDVFYRFINSVSANWNKFLLLFAIKVILPISELTSDKRINTLILDDTSFKRNRSKNVELLAKQYDHSINEYYSGFRCLTLTLLTSLVYRSIIQGL